MEPQKFLPQRLESLWLHIRQPSLVTCAPSRPVFLESSVSRVINFVQCNVQAFRLSHFLAYYYVDRLLVGIK